MRRRIAYTVAGIAVVLTACSGPSPAAAPGESPAPATPSVRPVERPIGLLWADGTPVEPRTIDPTDARIAQEGTDYRTLGTTPAGRSLNPLALRDDGLLVVADSPTGPFDGAWLPTSTTVGLWDGATFEPLPDAEGPALAHPVQAYAGDADDGLVAWVETDSTQAGVASWRVVALGPDGRARVLAVSTQVSATPFAVVSDEAHPTVVDGRVLWATPYPRTDAPTDDPADWGTEVLSAPADGSSPFQVAVTDATQPVAGSSGVVAFRSGTDTVAVLDRQGKSTAAVRLATPASDRISALAADGTHVVVVVTRGETSRLLVLDLSTRDAVAVPLPTRGPGFALAVCGDVVHWTSADGSGTSGEPQYVLDLATSTLARIDVPGAFGVAMCADHYLAWSSLDPAPGSYAQTVVARWG